MNDRYLKVILTVIALELLWLGVKDIGIPVAAQARGNQAAAAQPPAPQPVVIRGIELKDPAAVMPIAAASPVPVTPARTFVVDVDRPLPIIGTAPLKVETDKPLLIEAARPLPVEAVPYKGGKTPGE